MKHFINGVQVTPRNIFDIGISCDFTANIDQNKVTVDTIILPNEGKVEIEKHVNSVGYFEGLPYQIEYAPSKNLEYYIDFTQGYKVKDKEIEVNIYQRYGHDNFFEQASALTFEYLNTKYTIPAYKVGYNVNAKDAKARSLILSLALFSISMGIAQQVKELADTAKEFASIVAYNIAAGGKALEAALKLAITIVYLGVLIIQAAKLIEELIKLNFPKTRFLNASKVWDLVRIGCQELGYTFKSTLASGNYKDLRLIPIPLNETNKKFFEFFEDDVDNINKHYPTASDTTATLGQLIFEIEKIFNAKTRVVNKVVELERWDYWINNATNQITTPYLNQESKQNEYELDFSRLFKRYLIEFQKDFSDQTTIDYFERTVSEWSLDRTNIVNQDLNLIKGLSDVQINFAKCKPKTKLSFWENAFKELYKLIDKLAGTKLSNKAPQLNNIQLSEQYFSITKLFISDGGTKISPQSETILDPDYLFNNYHFINNPLNKQFIIKRGVKVPMTLTEFQTILDKNYVIIDGVNSEILNLEYFERKNYAILTYRQEKQIFKNAKLIKIY